MRGPIHPAHLLIEPAPMAKQDGVSEMLVATRFSGKISL
jgi:hypothetical protein